MNKLLSLILISACSVQFVACTVDDPSRRGGTVFHQTDESPRQGGSQGSHRYGSGGTHSPSESTARSRKKKTTRSSSRESRKRRSTPSDPDGIVKPRDLDPEPNRSEEPEIVSRTPEKTESKPMVEEKKKTTSSSSSEVPYAESVPGKYGLVYSPYVSDKKNGLVNVTDENNVPLPPGTEVEDPHTGKTFRVP